MGKALLVESERRGKNDAAPGCAMERDAEQAKLKRRNVATDDVGRQQVDQSRRASSPPNQAESAGKAKAQKEKRRSKTRAEAALGRAHTS